ncbi:MAG: hypothetical protein WC112_10080 [Proteiniphilum sp.]
MAVLLTILGIFSFLDMGIFMFTGKDIFTHVTGIDIFDIVWERAFGVDYSGYVDSVASISDMMFISISVIVITSIFLLIRRK